MSGGEPQSTPWQSWRVFLRFSLLNFALVVIGACFLMSSPPPTPGAIRFWEIWQWVFAFPFMAAERLGVSMKEWWWVFVTLNPFLYGAQWWFGWRMWRLMRPKPE